MLPDKFPIQSPNIGGWQLFRTKACTSAVSLLEALFALASISFVTIGLYGGLTQINQYATVSRLRTCATAILRDQIDRSLCAGRFDPINNNIPSEFPSLTGSNNTATTTQAVYIDPGTATSQLLLSASPALVSGSMTIAVTGTNVVVPVASGTATVISGTVTLQQVLVSLNYTYHNTNYTLQMNSLRAPDQ